MRTSRHRSHRSWGEWLTPRATPRKEALLCEGEVDGMEKSSEDVGYSECVVM